MLYSTFSEFMEEAIHRAESRINPSQALPMKIITIVYRLIERGWNVFSTTATLLKLGTIAFVAALAAFVISGVGIIVVAILAVVGFSAYEGMKYLYANKWYPLAILKVGTNVKSEYDSCKYDDYAVSQLLERAVEMLIRECS